VSISLVGGRNSSIGSIITSNLCFHAYLAGTAKMGSRSSAQTIEDGSVDKAIAPVAFRDISSK
jgi:hypothetical protein